MGKEKSKKDLLKKYATKSEEEMVKEQEDLEKEYKLASVQMETEIANFSTVIDELKNPNTEKVMCKVRRPMTEEWRKLIPEDVLKYQGKESEIPIEKAQEYEDLVYTMMAELIVQPKHDMEWWKANTSHEFVYLFQEHLMKVFEKMEKSVNNFLEPK